MGYTSVNVWPKCLSTFKSLDPPLPLMLYGYVILLPTHKPGADSGFEIRGKGGIISMVVGGGGLRACPPRKILILDP